MLIQLIAVSSQHVTQRVPLSRTRYSSRTNTSVLHYQDSASRCKIQQMLTLLDLEGIRFAFTLTS